MSSLNIVLAGSGPSFVIRIFIATRVGHDILSSHRHRMLIDRHRLECPLRYLLGGGFIFEEVIAFKKYIHRFAERLAHLGYSIRVLELDSKIFVEWPRPRTVAALRHSALRRAGVPSCGVLSTFNQHSEEAGGTSPPPSTGGLGAGRELLRNKAEA